VVQPGSSPCVRPSLEV